VVGVEDRRFRLILGVLDVAKHAFIDGFGFNLQTMYEAVCAAAHPQLRVIPEYIVALARAEDPELDVTIDDEANKLIDAIADIVCQEVEQLTLNLTTKMLIHDPDLQAIKHITTILNKCCHHPKQPS
jgi:hypothetical protein